MKILFSTIPPYPENVLMKACGYNQIFDQRTKKRSYVRVFGKNFYPRFHCYVSADHDTLVIDLHLDQKAPLYAGHTAHNGEYDGDVVEQEVERVRRIIQQRIDGVYGGITSNAIDSPPPMVFG